MPLKFHPVKEDLTPKEFFLSAIYLIISIIILGILDLGLEWFFDNVIFSVFNWFNHLSIFFKILLIFGGGVSIFYGLMTIIGRLSTLLAGLIFNKLPQNKFTAIAPFVLALANAIWFIVLIWKVPEHYNFWIVVELLMISGFIWGLSSIVLVPDEVKKIFGIS